MGKPWLSHAGKAAQEMRDDARASDTTDHLPEVLDQQRNYPRRALRKFAAILVVLRPASGLAGTGCRSGPFDRLTMFRRHRSQERSCRSEKRKSFLLPKNPRFDLYQLLEPVFR